MNKLTFNLPKYLPLNTIDGYIYDTLTSTNDQAWHLNTNQKINTPFFVIAKRQTAGKGQRGNRWESGVGGLYLSLYLNTDLPVQNLHHLTLLSAVGIISQLQKFNIPVKIKWLNDLILAEKKLGGILCETKISHQRIKKVVFGVGINYQNDVNSSGVNLNYWINQQKTNPIDNLEKLAKIIVLGLIKSYDNYCQNEIESIVKTYNNLLYNCGQSVLFSENKGILMGVDSLGTLNVKVSSSRATSTIKFSPEIYRISYHKSGNKYYLITEK